MNTTRFGRPADRQRLARVAAALAGNGIESEVVGTPEEARSRVTARIPEGAHVLTATSRTLELAGIVGEIEGSGRYVAVRPQYLALDRATHAAEIRRLRSAPDVVVGSVHAVTEAGQLVIASQTGSQLAPYVYGAGLVIWVIGAQKVVRDLDEALERVRDYAFPLEDERSRQAYGTPSGVNKILVVNREARPGRAVAILVEREIGF